MRLLQSCIVAFSMYSKIPMPRTQWTKEHSKYAMCFFPVVGAVIGMIAILISYGLERMGARPMVRGAVLLAVPIMISGGIHMDGFLDTMDAKSSYKEREEKLLILKDPHAGAFAIISGVLYMIISFAMYSELSGLGVYVMSIGYIYERALSALAVVTFHKAKTTGIVASFAEASDQKRVRNVQFIYIVLCIVSMVFIHPLYGVVCALLGMLVFLYYKKMSNQIFGGITGDLSGYFLQLCELAMLCGIVFTSYLK